MFGKTNWFRKCQVSTSRCENLLPSHFLLQMPDDINIKIPRESLRWKFQVKQITKSRKKTFKSMSKLHTEKNGLKIPKS